MKKNSSILILFLVLGIFLIAGCNKTTGTTGQATKSVASTGEVKEFTMTAQKFSFSPSTITVNQGDTVRIKIKSLDVTHGFTIKEFGVNKVLSPGKEVVVEFVADKTGTFKFYCSIPCGSGHSAMQGKLIVK